MDTNDTDGNTLSDGTRANTWDSQNRLISCTAGGTTSTYTYGSDGLRRTSTVNGRTTYYVYDGTMLVREMQQNAQGVLQSMATYLNGPRGPEYRRDDTQAEGTYTDSGGVQHPAGKTRWYVYDGLGSVVGEVDPSGNITSSGTFDVYGAKRSGGTGTATSRQGFVGSLGHVSDAETGLVYMRARYYDPNVGRFVSEDPMMNGVNWFAYCGSNPVNNTDSTGLMIDILCSSLDDAAERIQEAAQGSAIKGQVENLVMMIDERMSMMDAMFSDLGTDREGGQLIMRYYSSITGNSTTFRFDFTAKAIDLGGEAANSFNATGAGHAWAFTQVLRELAEFWGG